MAVPMGGLGRLILSGFARGFIGERRWGVQVRGESGWGKGVTAFCRVQLRHEKVTGIRTNTQFEEEQLNAAELKCCGVISTPGSLSREPANASSLFYSCCASWPLLHSPHLIL